MNDLPLLTEFAKNSGLELDDLALSLFAEYRDLLLHYNGTTNLIGPMNATQIEERLLMDSLTAAATYVPTGSIVDVGSGAGLPGIPLKILYPDLALTLVEPRKKRVLFLELAAKRLKLTSTVVVRSKIEASDIGVHDYVISKALCAPPKWLELALPITAPEGVIVCMHGPCDELLPKAEELALERIAYTASVKEAFDAHEKDVVRSVSVFRRHL